MIHRPTRGMKTVMCKCGSVLLGAVNFRFIMVLLYLWFIYYMYALKNPVTKNNVSLSLSLGSQR